MNLVALMDLVASIVILGASVAFFTRVWKRRAPRHLSLAICSLLLFTLLFYLCLTLEWALALPFFGNAEDFVSVLLPMFWGLVLYGLQQDVIRCDLQRSETLHRQFIENQPVGLCRTSLDAGGRFVLANRALARMLGYDTAAELMETRVVDFYQHPEDRDRVMAALLRDGCIERMELPGNKRDGTKIDTSMTMRLVRDADGTPIEIEGTVEDISSRKKAEAALQRRERLHRQAQRIARLGHWEISLNAEFPVWSEEMYRITGFDRDTYDGSLETLLERVHPEDRATVERLVPDAIETGAAIDHVHRLQFPDGRIKWVHVMGRVEYDDKGAPTGIVGTTQDVTHVKAAEIEREKSERRLLQAQKMEAIGTLAGGIAHDFNNILSSILGYTQLAMRELPADSPTAAKLDAVLQASLRARDLVANILAFGRASEKALQPVQVNLVVKEVIHLLRATIPANIAIEQNIARRCRKVIADPVQIHQIVMNLCTNAYHAIGPAGGRITVTLTEVDLGPNDLQAGFDVRPGRHVHLQVGDTGQGMDRTLLGKIFDPYFTTKEGGQGTGLGLSVVHGIVKKHNGQIAVYSEPGHGTVFHVFLPCVEADGDAAAFSGAPVVEGGSEHILVVDDEPLITGMLTELLGSLGYRVTAFNASEAALAFVAGQSDPPDLMITDMNMPVMCGDVLSRKVLALLPGLPIIICTGFSDNLDEARAKSIGIRAYLQKPVTELTLTRCIRDILADGAPDAQAPFQQQ